MEILLCHSVKEMESRRPQVVRLQIRCFFCSWVSIRHRRKRVLDYNLSIMGNFCEYHKDSSDLSDLRFRTHDQKMTVAANAMADRSAFRHRSYRIATRGRSFSLPNILSILLRPLYGRLRPGDHLDVIRVFKYSRVSPSHELGSSPWATTAGSSISFHTSSSVAATTFPGQVSMAVSD